jgi:hypothetical protein
VVSLEEKEDPNHEFLAQTDLEPYACRSLPNEKWEMKDFDLARNTLYKRYPRALNVG